VGSSTGTIFAPPTSTLDDPLRFYAVRNANIALLMLKLMPYFQLTEQITLFDTLIVVVRASSINRSKFCSERLLFQLLKMVKTLHNTPALGTTNRLAYPTSIRHLQPFAEDRLYVLIKLLAEHSITVRELTKMISLLKPLPGDLKVHHSVPFLFFPIPIFFRFPFSISLYFSYFGTHVFFLWFSLRGCPKCLRY